VISRRYLVALSALLALALLPTIRHGYLGYVEAATKVTAASLPAEVVGTPGVATTTPPVWMPDTFSEDSWAEKTYDVSGVGRLTLVVARGYDLKKLYHHPEIAVLRGRTFEPVRHAALAGGEPVYVLVNRSNERESAVYALVYDNSWVGNPYLLQMSSAFTSIWARRRPLTLVFAHGPVLKDGEPTAAVTELLHATVKGLEVAASGGS
jgi:hypothetical protein